MEKVKEKYFNTKYRPAGILLSPSVGGSSTTPRDVSHLPFSTPQMRWESWEHGLALREHENISGASQYEFIY